MKAIKTRSKTFVFFMIFSLIALFLTSTELLAGGGGGGGGGSMGGAMMGTAMTGGYMMPSMMGGMWGSSMMSGLTGMWGSPYQGSMMANAMMANSMMNPMGNWYNTSNNTINTGSMFGYGTGFQNSNTALTNMLNMFGMNNMNMYGMGMQSGHTDDYGEDNEDTEDFRYSMGSMYPMGNMYRYGMDNRYMGFDLSNLTSPGTPATSSVGGGSTSASMGMMAWPNAINSQGMAGYLSGLGGGSPTFTPTSNAAASYFGSSTGTASSFTPYGFVDPYQYRYQYAGPYWLQ